MSFFLNNDKVTIKNLNTIVYQATYVVHTYPATNLCYRLLPLPTS